MDELIRALSRLSQLEGGPAAEEIARLGNEVARRYGVSVAQVGLLIERFRRLAIYESLRFAGRTAQAARSAAEITKGEVRFLSWLRAGALRGPLPQSSIRLAEAMMRSGRIPPALFGFLNPAALLVMAVVIAAGIGLYLYYSNRAVPQVASTYLGCYMEPGRTITERNVSGLNTMTNEKCASICGAFDYKYMATSAGAYCFCGNTFTQGHREPEANCNVPCDGNEHEKCGGWNRMSVFENRRPS